MTARMKLGNPRAAMVQLGHDGRNSGIFGAALIPRGGSNGGNSDFPVAEVKRMLVRRLAWLALTDVLVGQNGD